MQDGSDTDAEILARYRRGRSLELWRTALWRLAAVGLAATLAVLTMRLLGFDVTLGASALLVAAAAVLAATALRSLALRRARQAPAAWVARLDRCLGAQGALLAAQGEASEDSAGPALPPASQAQARFAGEEGLRWKHPLRRAVRARAQRALAARRAEVLAPSAGRMRLALAFAGLALACLVGLAAWPAPASESGRAGIGWGEGSAVAEGSAEEAPPPGGEAQASDDASDALEAAAADESPQEQLDERLDLGELLGLAIQVDPPIVTVGQEVSLWAQLRAAESWQAGYRVESRLLVSDPRASGDEGFGPGWRLAPWGFGPEGLPLPGVEQPVVQRPLLPLLQALEVDDAPRVLTLRWIVLPAPDEGRLKGLAASPPVTLQITPDIERQQTPTAAEKPVSAGREAQPDPSQPPEPSPLGEPEPPELGEEVAVPLPEATVDAAVDPLVKGEEKIEKEVEVHARERLAPQPARRPPPPEPDPVRYEKARAAWIEGQRLPARERRLVERYFGPAGSGKPPK